MENLEDLLSSIKAEHKKPDSAATPAQPKDQSTGQTTERSSSTGEKTRPLEDLLAQLEGQPPVQASSSAIDVILTDLPTSKPISKVISTPISKDILPTSSDPLDLLDQTLKIPFTEPSAKPLNLSELSSLSSTSISSTRSPISPDPSPSLISAPLPILEDLKAQYLEEQRQREAQERAEEEAARVRQRQEEERLRQEQEAALARQRQEEERQAKEKQARIEKAAQTWLSQLQPLSGEAIWFDEFARHYRSRLEAAIDYLNLDS